MRPGVGRAGESVQGYDIIGDIHGCATLLKKLLDSLGYRSGSGSYRHLERTAVFVGDLVDRGSEQREVLEIVKAMVDSGAAHIAMGNHEFNAVAFATEDPRKAGEFMRRHEEKNVRQHRAFLDQLTPDQRIFYLDWFKTLPLWVDLGGVRVVHACWHPDSMRVVEKICGSNRLSTTANFIEAATKGTELYEAVEILLKGPEICLTDLGHPPYRDFGGAPRTKARVRWWDQDACTLREVADVRGVTLLDGSPYPPLPADPVDEFYRSVIYTESVPVIYGHYWFQWERHREDWTTHTACVDFSAVAGGKLVAYRWSGEPTISWENYLPHTVDVVAREPSA